MSKKRTKKYGRLIVKFENDAIYYPNLGQQEVLKKNGRRVKTIISDGVMTVANKNMKVTIFEDGEIKVEPHQLDGIEKL